MAETHPHITVGHHDRYGVVAATSHDNHVADHILRLVGFERLHGSHLYGLSDPTREPLRRGAQAVQSLRAALYSVTSDAAYDREPNSRLDRTRGLSDRQKDLSAMPTSGMAESPFASARALEGDIRADQVTGHDRVRDPEGTLRAVGAYTRTSKGVLLHGEADVRNVVSPACTGVSAPRRPAASVEYRPTAAALQPSRTR
ncbi:hypothetical protein [Streptomyces sp. NPDC056982]|uniref:hypothetical protein n=1 Tax=Streptomyces sp. NPDC056982 TaxID=3345986 RepID=UPI003629A182